MIRNIYILLEEHGFNVSNSKKRLLSFSMAGKVIPIGDSILTTITGTIMYFHFITPSVKLYYIITPQ